MRSIELLHRWGGGLVGLILAVLGLTGAILVHKDDWIALPHVSDKPVTDPIAVGQLTAHLLQNAKGGESLIYASDSFGLVQLRNGGGGAYFTQFGDVVARWGNQWERPELWLFDLHHYLFAGEAGKVVVGLAGLAAVVFIVTGTILWWRTRRTFRLRIWPARMSGPAIRMQHRDLGLVTAPILLLLALTGSMLTFRPVASFLLSPLTAPSVMEAELASPVLSGGKLSQNVDWAGIVIAAYRAFPEAQIRILTLPKKSGDPIIVRMKQESEWLPNGRSMLWFNAANGRLLARRDALAVQAGTQAFNMLYPVHAAKVGGTLWRMISSFAGVALTLLGSLAVWSFWFKPSARDILHVNVRTAVPHSPSERRQL